MDLPWLVYKLVFGTDRAEIKRRRTHGLLHSVSSDGALPGNVKRGGALYPAHPDYDEYEANNPRARRRNTRAAVNAEQRQSR